MARLGSAGAEIEVAAAGTTATTPDCRNFAGTTTRDTTVFRSGVASLKCAGTAAAAATAQWPLGRAAVAATADVSYFWRFYVYVDAYPTSTIEVGRCASTGAGLPSVRMTSTGTLQFWSGTAGSGAQIGSDSAVLNLATWYRVEFGWNWATAGNGTQAMQLDGVSVASGSVGGSASLPGDTSLITGWQSAPGVTANLYVDDVAMNDSTGANQTSWPGDGKVVLLKPISDNARTAGWVTGAGGTTSLWDAVNNTPPTGAADTGTATSQIRNATAEASASYDANLTAYTTAGIGAADTINVVLPLVATAAPVTTSSKQGLIGMASNPAITTVALSAGGTAGAFWAGFAAAAYPSGWKWSRGTTTYAPSVTLGSSPVARITQVTSSTRIADVCAMGMYVDYTPAAPKAPPFQARTARNTLLRR
jgi:hypothetical protein